MRIRRLLAGNGGLSMRQPKQQVSSEVPVTSSCPLQLPLEQEAVFREVLTLFEASQLPYAVAGAFALRQHTGVCRFTKDLDLFMTSRDASEGLRCLRHHGFECEVCDPVWLAKAHRNGFFVDLITGMSNGVFAVDHAWIEKSLPAVICGVNSRVLAPEELIVSKLFVTRRERFDGADIAHIIFGSRGKLQWGRILELTGDHWEILLWALMLFRYVYPAHTDYVPQSLWQDLLTRLAEEIRVPRPSARFRGSLVDEAMFAIDIDEWGLDNILRESRGRRIGIVPPPKSRRRSKTNP
jgi:hypothetical protein